MRGMAAMKQNTRKSNPHPEQQMPDHNKENSRSGNPIPDDEGRTPPPMDIVTDASSNHPDFEAWKRDMTQKIMSGTVRMSGTKNNCHTSDWKNARMNKRHNDKKILHQQLRSVKSDTSTTSESESSDDANSSNETSNSSTFLKQGKDARKNCISSSNGAISRKVQSSHEIRTVYVRNQSRTRNPESYQEIISTPESPRSTASAVETPLSPKGKPNSNELATIMAQLADLKTWADGTPSVISVPKTSSTSHAIRAKAKALSSSEEHSFPKSIIVPNMEHKSIVTPKPTQAHAEAEKQCEAKGITLTIQTEHVRKCNQTKTDKPQKKNRVRFARPLITDTIYRPKTPREDVDALYFQEEELEEWEHDEVTTVRDRFEITVANFGSCGEGHDTTFSGMLSIGTPVISFHDSYSFSFADSSDDESTSIDDSDN